MRVREEAEAVVKEAESDAERIRLGLEARILQAVAHPGIVRLARVEGAERPERPHRLYLHRVRGTCLADEGRQAAATVAGWGAAVATVLADLHDLGYAHGNIRAEHILMDEHGRPVLCGFGCARRVSAEEATTSFQADVAALARLLSERLPAGEVVLRRALSRYVRTRPGRRSTARALASILVQRVPDARLGPAAPVSGEAVASTSGGTSPDGTRRRLPGGVLSGANRPGGARAAGGRASGVGASGVRASGVRASGVRAGRVVPAAIAVAVSLVGAALLVRGASGRPGHAALAARAAVPAYVLQAAAGEEPLTVVGRWACGPATPAVLDARTGAVWLFPDWPAPGSATTGRLLDQVHAAMGLAVERDQGGCDRLIVLREGAPDLPVTTGGGR